MDFGIWFLIGAALVFFMQAGFAMVETGFTRAKNAGNIIMKNLMDFCIGTVAFSFLGAGLMLGEDKLAGLVGLPTLGVWNNFTSFDWSSFVFNLVFCATAATIVSGAVAERTKFSSYCIYSFIISLVIYPIEAHWVWGGGWLVKHGFIDFAGSACIHSVGGLCALIGAIMIGARTGKYIRNEEGKVTKINAIQGHNVLMGSLGVFILWFGWYGFNPAACTSYNGFGGMGHVFMTTTVAASLATVTVMLFTWIRNGKPDVSMTLNGSLAGLVAITAGCARVDLLGSIIIGIVSGIILCVGVEFIDKKLHIDDPVGACSVHFLNGVWGTLACGLFAYDTGLFYGHGGWQLLVQVIGVLATCAWTAVWAFIVFGIMKKVKKADGTPFLRASEEEEIRGLDITEHGLLSAYAGFAFAPEEIDYTGVIKTTGDVPPAEAVEVTHLNQADTIIDAKYTANSSNQFTKIEIICRERMLDTLKNAMLGIGINGMTVSHVLGCGIQKGKPEYYRGVMVEATLLPKVQVDIVTTSDQVSNVITTAKKTLYTGHIGDGKIFIYDVLNIIKVRTGEEGKKALVDTEARVDVK